MPTISQAPKKPSNRRGSPRRRARQSVQIECRKGGYGLGPNLAQGVLDLSDSGVRLLVKEGLETGDEVEIVISAYGIAKPIKRGGYVRWHVKGEADQLYVGIEFQKRLAYRDWQNLISAA